MIFAKFQEGSRAYSQLAGALYLLIAVVGGFSIGYVPGEMVVDGDASATYQNLLEKTTLFQLGVTGDITVLLLETVLTVMLFRLFKTYSGTGILVATFSRLAMAIIMAINLVIYMFPFILSMQPDFLQSFQTAQLETLTLLFFKVHKFGELAWQLFFALHLFALGYVLRKSGLVPKWMGILMLIGSFGYGGDSFIQFISFNEQLVTVAFSVLLVLAVISEFWFAFWLLLKGGRNPVSA